MRTRYLLFTAVVLCIFFLTCIPRGATAAKSKEDTYWDNGKIRGSSIYNDEGARVEESYYREDGSLEQRIIYDKDGRHKIEEVNYDEGGRLRENFDGWAAIKWRYEDGNLVEEKYYGSDGHLKERKVYNELGDLVGKQYVGDDIDPDEEFTPEPTLSGETVEYDDEYGRPELTEEAYQY